MQLKIVPPKIGDTSYTVYITDGTFHYVCQYEDHPPDDHIPIHLERAKQSFEAQRAQLGITNDL